MDTALMALAAVSVAELILWTPFGWWARKGFSLVIACLLALFSFWIFAVGPSIWTGLILGVSAYRVFNLLRLYKGRMHEQYLQRVTRRTALWLMVLQASIGLVGALSYAAHVPSGAWFAVVTIITLVSSITIAFYSRWNVGALFMPPVDLHFTDKDLPSLTVAIPARNETEDLEECLRTLTASNYPKLEILVLDDCSQNTRTPEIIRAFAHDGVRFIAGEEPSPTWLAKNYAYQRLYEAASGELILFCGVDCRFEPSSLRAMVTALLEKQTDMMSFVPQNVLLGSEEPLNPLLVQPMRYAWELAVPREALRPPVLSTCWLARKQLLESSGSFAAVSRMMVPESYLARQASFMNGYSFVAATNDMPLSSRKPFTEQRNTTIRTRYPQLHRRPELVCLLTLAELTVLIVPFLNILLALIFGFNGLFLVVNLLSATGLLYAYGLMAGLAYRRNLALGYCLAPLAAAYDIYLLHTSMWKYEFSEVIWKGRNVCIPVMHVYPHLPNLQ